MILRYVSNIPQHHLKMVRYYGFLSNRKRGCLLPPGVLSVRKEELEAGGAAHVYQTVQRLDGQ